MQAGAHSRKKNNFWKILVEQWGAHPHDKRGLKVCCLWNQDKTQTKLPGGFWTQVNNKVHFSKLNRKKKQIRNGTCQHGVIPKVQFHSLWNVLINREECLTNWPIDSLPTDCHTAKLRLHRLFLPAVASLINNQQIWAVKQRQQIGI